MTGLLAFAMEALTALPGLITAGKDIMGLVQSTNSVLSTAQAEKRDPTDQEWATLNNTIAALRKELHS